MAEADSFKNRHLISCDKELWIENWESLIKQLQEDITFLRKQLKNKDEIIHSFIQQLAKYDNIVVECNPASNRETLNKTQPKSSAAKHYLRRTLIGHISYFQWD